VDLIGDVDAAGRTTEEIADEIEQRIAQYRQGPLATVSVETTNSASVTVLGEVRTPGRHPITQETRLAEAIALSGGATILAAASRVRLIRTERDRTLAYQAILDDIQDGEGSTNVVLGDGDPVFVPPATPVAVATRSAGRCIPWKPCWGSWRAACWLSLREAPEASRGNGATVEEERVVEAGLPEFVRDPLGIVQRHWVAMVATALVGMAATAFVTLTRIPLYSAKATVMLAARRSRRSSSARRSRRTPRSGSMGSWARSSPPAT
jgi:hypothetical protein